MGFSPGLVPEGSGFRGCDMGQLRYFFGNTPKALLKFRNFSHAKIQVDEWLKLARDFLDKIPG